MEDDSLDLYPTLTSAQAAADTVEGDPDKAFVDGIIACAEGEAYYLDDPSRGPAWRHGYDFANRWGERGTDLGNALKYFRENAGKRQQPDLRVTED